MRNSIQSYHTQQRYSYLQTNTLRSTQARQSSHITIAIIEMEDFTLDLPIKIIKIKADTHMGKRTQ